MIPFAPCPTRSWSGSPTTSPRHPQPSRQAQRHERRHAARAGRRFDDLDARATCASSWCAAPGRVLLGRDLPRHGAGRAQVEIVPVLRKVEDSRHPTIALIHGRRHRGGCELALHCDLRVAAEGARSACAARIGLVPGFRAGPEAARDHRPAHTRHLLFTGRPIEAGRALEIGMVHEVVPAAEVRRRRRSLRAPSPTTRRSRWPASRPHPARARGARGGPARRRRRADPGRAPQPGRGRGPPRDAGEAQARLPRRVTLSVEGT